MPDGTLVHAWTLKGSGGLEIEVLTYGGIVRRIMAPDRNGAFSDVVLGYNTLEGYINDACFMGATAGRIAGRVTGGKLKVDGQVYDLLINDEPNHLHGGPDSLNRKVWKAEAVEGDDGAPSLKLTYESPDGEQGYPGKAYLSVFYTVTAENHMVFETKAVVDRTTPISLTHHSYFNLSGEGVGTINDHRMEIASDSVASSDKYMTLLNKLAPVDSTAADMRQPTRLGDVIPDLWEQHGDLYWLGESDAPKRIARVEDPASGRVMEVITDCTCLQTYFSTSFDGSFGGKSGRKYEQFGAFCMECEGYPEAANVDGFGDITVRPGEEQHTTTIYAFSTN